jgi:hypothetical protein
MKSRGAQTYQMCAVGVQLGFGLVIYGGVENKLVGQDLLNNKQGFVLGQ